MIIQPDVAIKVKTVQVPGKNGDEIAIAFIWICSMAVHKRYAMAYDGALFQVMGVMDMCNIENMIERRRVHHYFGIVRAVYVRGEED